MQTHRAFATTATLLALGVAACSDPTSPNDSAALFQTDRPAYTLEPGAFYWEARVRWIFTNKTAEPVLFANCGGDTPLMFETLVGGAWVPKWGPAMMRCLSAPFTVPPGGTHVADVEIIVGYGNNPIERLIQAREWTGTFRMRWDYAAHQHNEGTHVIDNVLPLEQRVSNRFALQVELPPR